MFSNVIMKGAICLAVITALLLPVPAMAMGMQKVKTIVNFSDPASAKNPFSGVTPGVGALGTVIGVSEGSDKKLYASTFFTGAIYRITVGGKVRRHAQLPLPALNPADPTKAAFAGVLHISKDGTIYVSVFHQEDLNFSESITGSQHGVYRVDTDGTVTKVFPAPDEGSVSDPDGSDDSLSKIITGIEYDERNDTLYVADCKVGIIHKISNASGTPVAANRSTFRSGGFLSGTQAPWQFLLPFADPLFEGTGINDIELDEERNLLYGINTNGSDVVGGQVLRMDLTEAGVDQDILDFKNRPIISGAGDSVIAFLPDTILEGLNLTPDGEVLVINLPARENIDPDDDDWNVGGPSSPGFDFGQEIWAFDVRREVLDSTLDTLGPMSDSASDSRAQKIADDPELKGFTEEINVASNGKKIYVSASGFIPFGMGDPNNSNHNGWIKRIKNLADFPSLEDLGLEPYPED